jgi:hypothetical protein
MEIGTWPKHRARQQKDRPSRAGLFVLDITAVPRYARANSTATPSDVRLLMGITSFTLLGVGQVCFDSDISEPCLTVARVGTGVNVCRPGTTAQSVSSRMPTLISQRNQPVVPHTFVIPRNEESLREARPPKAVPDPRRPFAGIGKSACGRSAIASLRAGMSRKLAMTVSGTRL